MNNFNSVVPAIASSGSAHAIVHQHGTTPTQIYFRPLDASGVPTGNEIMVSDAPMPSTQQPQSNAVVTWGPANGEWAVLWNNNDPMNGNNSRVFFRRVSAAGVALGSPIQIAPTPPITTPTGIERTGGQIFFWNPGSNSYVAGWAETSPDRNVIGFITKDGVLTSKGIAVTAPTARDLAIAYRSGVGYGVTWAEFPGAFDTWTVSFGRTDLSGNAIAGSRIILNSPGSLPSSAGVAWTGTDWLVTWAEAPSSTSTIQHIWTARIDASGVLVPARAGPSPAPAPRTGLLTWSGTAARRRSPSFATETTDGSSSSSEGARPGCRYFAAGGGGGGGAQSPSTAWDCRRAGRWPSSLPLYQ
jgi:hypothetical protein